MSNRAILPMREDGLARKKWSVGECRFLTDNGLLKPGSFELIEGEIVFKMSQEQPHINHNLYCGCSDGSFWQPIPDPSG